VKRNLSASPPEVNGKLVVREERAAFFVAREEDPDDWLVRFDKDGGFPAREWADNMVRVFNRRLERCTPVPSTPPGMRPSSYHPGRVSP
jgi:hypothetical protein